MTSSQSLAFCKFKSQKLTNATLKTRIISLLNYLTSIKLIMRICISGLSELEKNYHLNLPFGQASLKIHLPGQDFINCYFSLVHEQLVHILAHRASEWGKSLVRHKNLLVPDDRTGLFSGSGYRHFKLFLNVLPPPPPLSHIVYTYTASSLFQVFR